MTDIVSLSELRLLARQRADMENSQFISDDEWRRMINRSYSELYDLVVTSANSEDYFLKSDTISLVNGTDSYDLPTDFYKMRGVDINSGGTSTPLRRYNFSQRNVGSLYAIASDMRYHVQGSKIFFPTPSTIDTVTLWYIPSPKKFLEYTVTAITRGASTMWTIGAHNFVVDDLLDGVNFLVAANYNVNQKVTAVGTNTVTTDLNSAGLADPTFFGEIESRYDFYSGWDEYVIVSAAISALIKEEADVSALFAIKQQLSDRIIAVSEMRDLGEPTTVTDVSSYNALIV